MDNVKKTKENTAITELNIIQHAILERYTKSKLTHEELPGEKLSSDSQELSSMKNLGIELKGKVDEYYKIGPNNGIAELGIRDEKKEKDEYIVNYETGEAFNYTQKTTESGKLLYVFAKEAE